MHAPPPEWQWDESVQENPTEVLVVDDDGDVIRETTATFRNEPDNSVSRTANGEADPGQPSATVIDGIHLPSSPQTADECRKQAEHFERCAQIQADVVKSLLLVDLAKFYRAKAACLDGI
jgi:hypothetical protein